jgi:hypothetical protein
VVAVGPLALRRCGGPDLREVVPVSAALIVLAIAVLYCAACLDWLAESTPTATSPLCPCGCGNPTYRHNQPRSAR